MVDFDIAPVKPSIIMCAGVGGGGGNAVKHMFKLGIADVTFVICNTDRQALEDSPVPIKIRLGDKLTGGLGAGNKPERGRQAALESLDQIKEMFTENDTRMLFVTAGMGGGTGTGAAPVIAQAAREMGILTVAIVSIPFKTEGRRRLQQAIEGIEEISKYVDSLLVVDNESINEIYGDLTLSDAFGKADDILATAAKSIADIITSHFKINVDFEDVKTVMQNSGVALMGSAQGQGEKRAIEVATNAMSSPLLNQKDISGAQNVLLNISSGSREVTMRETYEITEYIQQRAGNDNTTDLIWGAGQDDSLGDDIRVTVIATGFGMDSIPALRDRLPQAPNQDKDIGKPTSKPRETINLDEPEKPLKVAPQNDTGFSVVLKNQPETDYEPIVQPRTVRQETLTASSQRLDTSINKHESPAPGYRSSANVENGSKLNDNEIGTTEQITTNVPTPTVIGIYNTDDSASSKNVQQSDEEVSSLQNQLHTAISSENATNSIERQHIATEGSPLIPDISEEALNIPAWKRRGVQLETFGNSSKGQRETLKGDPTTEKIVVSPDLFE